MPKPIRPVLLVYGGLHDKLQVKLIAKRLGTDTFEVVGRLIQVWLEFQRRADDNGVLLGRSREWVDLVADRPGFAAAMAEAGWLDIRSDRIIVPNFDEYIARATMKRLKDAERLAAKRLAEQSAFAGERATETRQDATPGNKVPSVPVAPDVKPKKRNVSGLGSPLFDRFWAAYPRKEGKADAAKAWGQVGPVDEELLARMIAAIGRQSRSDQWVKDNGQYIPYPATWLRGRRWEDEPGSGGVPGRPRQPVQPTGRVAAGEGQYGRKRSIDEQDPPAVPPGGPPGLF